MCGAKVCFRIPKATTMLPMIAVRTVLFRHLPPGYSRALRLLSSRAAPEELQGQNAYEVLGVSESSTFAEIKASFRNLAKENHPDVNPSENASASRRFLLILAAYEILSDAEKKAHYDSYLCFEREVLQVQKQHKKHETRIYTYNSSVKLTSQIEVVEWLKCYRLVVDDILSQSRYQNGSRYWNHIQNGLRAAINTAYYGPLIESIDVLPACFEAEERSTGGTSEVLHLVSGQHLFGIVYVLNRIHSLCHSRNYKKLDSFQQDDPAIFDGIKSTLAEMDRRSKKRKEMSNMHVHFSGNSSDAYSDLELHISGEVVATATRLPPNASYSEGSAGDLDDIIHVFLKFNEVPDHPAKRFCPDHSSSDAHGSPVLLGAIKGLGTSPEEGSCFVYDKTGTKTHLIVKHRTLLVKHLHWFSIGDDTLLCECRCSRARLPSSKYWLFRPRCSMHDIGGWYIEMFDQDKHGKTILSQRQWDGSSKHYEKRLHPAMYLLALAYRTLDIEVAKRQTRTIRNIFVSKLQSVLQWCKKLV